MARWSESGEWTKGDWGVNPQAIKLALRILIVEDHDDTLRVLAGVLRRRSHIVWEASTAAHARILMADQDFDVLLSDIALPDGDGCDLMKEAREPERMLAIAMSAHAQAHDQERCKCAGFGHFIPKPGVLEKLLSLLEQHSRERIDL